MVGPTLQVSLPVGFAVEASALYERLGDRSGDCEFTYCSSARRRANSWQAPIVLKKYVRFGPIAPFAGIGYSIRRVGQATSQMESYRTGPIVSGEVVDYTVHRGTFKAPSQVSHGLVAAAGVEFRAGDWKIAPEFRYTRWAPRFWEESGSHGFFTASNPNHYEIHLSIRR